MMATRPLIAGNWKMNTTISEGAQLAEVITGLLPERTGADVVLLPPFTHLSEVRAKLDKSEIELGAQDIFWEPSGAYTGEISGPMLREICQWVLVGHSERRRILGETNRDCGRKMRAALESKLKVILAVGETEEERDAGYAVRVVEEQIDAVFGELRAAPAADEYVVAYEPVWAIGTGRTASAQEADAMCGFVARHVHYRARELGGRADTLRVLYGGSANPKNAAELLAQPAISGLLVGGASLVAQDFAAIVDAAIATAAAAPSV